MLPPPPNYGSGRITVTSLIPVIYWVHSSPFARTSPPPFPLEFEIPTSQSSLLPPPPNYGSGRITVTSLIPVLYWVHSSPFARISPPPLPLEFVNTVWEHSLVPRPHPLTRKRGLVTIERFLGCGESAKCHLSCDLNSATKARVGSGHETTNSSVSRAHGCMT